MSRYDNSEVENAEAEDITLLLEADLPWPEDIFGKVPDKDWPKINEFAKKKLGYPLDCISGDLMRHGWKVRQRQLQEAVNDLADDDSEANTKPVESAEKEFKQAIQDNIKASKRLAEVASANTDIDTILVEFGQILQRYNPESHDHIKGAYRQARAALESIIKQRELEARIEELSSIQLEYGHYQAQTFIDGQAQLLEDRVAKLREEREK